MPREQPEPDGARVHPVGAQLRDQHQVAQALGHLLAVPADHPGVDVVAREPALLGDRFGVRGRELVVREDQVAAAALHVETHAQARQRDGRTLDVPARPARTERRLPAGLTLAGGPPHQRVERIGLAGPVGVPAALGEQRAHGVLVVAGLVAELLGGVGPEVDVGELGVVDGVGRAGGQHLLDEFDDLVDGVGGRDVVLRRQHPQRAHVLAEQLGLAVAEVAPVDAVPVGPLEQRIVDVGDVLHVVHLMPGIQPHPVHQIEGQIRRGVPEVGGVVRGDAADVHGGRGARRDGTHLPVRAVEQSQLRCPTGQLRN